HRLVDWKWAVVGVFLAGLTATYFVNRLVPTSFIPAEDQGWFLAIVQAPPGASLQYTTKVMDQAAGMMSANPNIAGVFSVPGFSFGSSAPNQGLIFATLKDFSERKGKGHSVEDVVGTLRGQFMGISEAAVVPFVPPTIFGLGNFGGFAYELQQTGGGPPGGMGDGGAPPIPQANKPPEPAPPPFRPLPP